MLNSNRILYSLLSLSALFSLTSWLFSWGAAARPIPAPVHSVVIQGKVLSKTKDLLQLQSFIPSPQDANIQLPGPTFSIMISDTTPVSHTNQAFSANGNAVETTKPDKEAAIQIGDFARINVDASQDLTESVPALDINYWSGIPNFPL